MSLESCSHDTMYHPYRFGGWNVHHCYMVAKLRRVAVFNLSVRSYRTYLESCCSHLSSRHRSMRSVCQASRSKLQQLHPAGRFPCNSNDWQCNLRENSKLDFQHEIDWVSAHSHTKCTNVASCSCDSVASWDLDRKLELENVVDTPQSNYNSPCF